MATKLGGGTGEPLERTDGCAPPAERFAGAGAGAGPLRRAARAASARGGAPRLGPAALQDRASPRGKTKQNKPKQAGAAGQGPEEPRPTALHSSNPATATRPGAGQAVPGPPARTLAPVPKPCPQSRGRARGPAGAGTGCAEDREGRARPRPAPRGGLRHSPLRQWRGPRTAAPSGPEGPLALRGSERGAGSRQPGSAILSLAGACLLLALETRMPWQGPSRERLGSGSWGDGPLWSEPCNGGLPLAGAFPATSLLGAQSSQAAQLICC